MNRNQRRHLSRTIAHALRHAPHLYELELDEHGWTPVDQLLEGLRGHRLAWRDVDVATIRDIVEQDSKGRYELDDTEARVRALYGHSTTTKLLKTEAKPPEILCHGTSPAIADVILEEGLKPMARQYVHHAVDEATALEVGRRKDEAPVLLHVHAQRAWREGVVFYRGNDLIWLSEPVPPEFISRAVTS